MYWTYLRRELSGRKKQTMIVAMGLAIAIALVIVVNALAAGVRDAQADALESVYGVGTDLTVSGAAVQPGEGGGGPRFEFDAGDGATSEGTTALSQSRLMTDLLRATLEASALEAARSVEGVSAAAAGLSLTNTTFSGEVPDRTQPDPPTDQDGAAPEGAGGSAFDIVTFSVLGIDPADTSVGPLADIAVEDGRALAASDEGENVAVLDASYAASEGVAVGDTIEVGGTPMEVVGIIASATSEADTAADVYIPLDVAQTLSGAGEVISTIYVQAESAEAIAAVQASLQEALPDGTVSSQSELAGTVSGSLSSAASLITSLGTWLSALALAAAVVLAMLFTGSGVARRTREFGTLKAIGWSNGRVVGQVTGESLAQGLLGGALGLLLGLSGIWIINAVQPTISAGAAAEQSAPGAGPEGGGFLGGPTRNAVTDIVLTAPLTLWVPVAAVGLAVASGLIAGAFGGWRAARLSPAEALRSVA